MCLAAERRSKRHSQDCGHTRSDRPRRTRLWRFSSRCIRCIPRLRCIITDFRSVRSEWFGMGEQQALYHCQRIKHLVHIAVASISPPPGFTAWKNPRKRTFIGLLHTCAGGGFGRRLKLLGEGLCKGRSSDDCASKRACSNSFVGTHIDVAPSAAFTDLGENVAFEECIGGLHKALDGVGPFLFAIGLLLVVSIRLGQTLVEGAYNVLHDSRALCINRMVVRPKYLIRFRAVI
jgi:hypothetical protein